MDNRAKLLKNIGNYVILGSIVLVWFADLGNKSGGPSIFLFFLILGFVCILVGEAMITPFDMGNESLQDLGDEDSLAMKQESSDPSEESGSFYRENEGPGGLY